MYIERIVKHSVFFFLTAIFCVNAFSAELTFSGNQSDIRWKTASTSHFNFIYPAEYSGHAGTVASTAEAVYDSIVSRYSFSLPSRIDVSLQNALYANGSAVPNENAMNLFLSNWDFKLRSTHPWISDVVSHEFSHLVSIESGSKLPHFIYGLQLSYFDYYNERSTENASLVLPFTLQPLWLAEGTAQFESARMGFDGWDSHRDMLLRTAVLNDGLLDLNYMHDFADNSLDAELGPYTQGFALVRYIDSTYGPEALPKIWHELSKPYRITLSGAIEKILGISEDSLYENWKASITEHYRKQQESLGATVTGKKWTADAFYQDFPVMSGQALYGVSNFGGPWFDGGVFKIPKSAADSLLADSTLDISKFAKSGFKPEKPWFDKGISVREIAGKGPVLAYVTYKKRDRNGHAHFDIAVADTNKNSALATVLADAVYPDISPDGKEIVFVRREPNSSRFVLSLVALPEFDSKGPDEIRDIYVPDSKLLYYNIYSPKFSPDGKKIAFSFFDDKRRGILIVDHDGKVLAEISQAGIDFRDPNWIDDKTLVYSNNRNGIFNLYSRKLDAAEEYPLTNVLGGAFTPAIDSGTIYYTLYDEDGFSLYSLSLTDYAATRDSTFAVFDTTFTTCPEPLADTLLAAGDSLSEPSDSLGALTDKSLALAPCKIDTLIVSHDSIIRKPKTPPLILSGKVAEKPSKQLEFTELEFAGAERNYKPIPTKLLLAPLFTVEERAPDFGVKGDGQAVPKLGLAMSLSDPLKKNILSAGFLIEVGNGFDYFADGGINPEMEREFVVALENHSTPITLGISYTNANYRSKDTVRYEDPRSYEDSVGTSRYAIPLNAIQATAAYSIFKEGDSIFVAGGYDWANFNLYEDNLEWTYQKRLSASVGISLSGSSGDETATNTVGAGNGISAVYQFANSDLYRPGTFSESFTVSPSGKITPIYRNYSLHSFYFNLHGSLANPIHSGARFAAGATISGIGSWSAKNSSDTLDSYYHLPLLLEGYPYLITTEDYNRSGLKTAKAEIHYLFPIFEDWRNQLWIFSTRDFFINLYAQIGAAWNDHGVPVSKFKHRDFWDRSVGLEFRLANRIFYTLPFNISLNLARGLDRIGEDENGKGGTKMSPIDIPILPKAISPTRISFLIGFDFNNTWME